MAHHTSLIVCLSCQNTRHVATQTLIKSNLADLTCTCGGKYTIGEDTGRSVEDYFVAECPGCGANLRPDDLQEEVDSDGDEHFWCGFCNEDIPLESILVDPMELRKGDVDISGLCRSGRFTRDEDEEEDF